VLRTLLSTASYALKPHLTPCFRWGCHSVTAEVAGSSPVVPAIHSKKLTGRMELKLQRNLGGFSTHISSLFC
jgi:hypothetical protein